MLKVLVADPFYVPAPLLWMRRQIVTRPLGPLRALFVVAYGRVARWAGAWLSRQPGVMAVYLRRGAASGDLEPGLSDLDFGVVVGEGADPEQLLLDWRRLRRWMPILDRSLEIYAAADLPRLLTDSPYHQHRLVTMRHAWQRLHGPPLLEELTLPPGVGPLPGLLGEAAMWWSLLTLRLVERTPPDPLTRDVTLYKVVAETCRVELAAAGPCPHRRDDALRLALPAAGEGEGPLLSWALELPRRRWRSADDRAGEVLPFVWRRLEGMSTWLPRANARHPWRLEGDLARDPVQLRLRQEVSRLLERWPATCPLAGAWLVPSAWFHLDERLLLLWPQGGHLPDLATLRWLARSAAAVPGLRVYIGGASRWVQLDVGEMDMSWRSVLWTPWSPDLTAAMADPATWVVGQGPAPLDPGAWDAGGVRRMLSHEVRLLAAQLHTRRVFQLEDSDLARLGLKCLQLQGVLSELDAQPRFAVTPEAVTRDVPVHGVRALAEPSPLGAYFGPAVAGLRNLFPMESV